MVDEASTEISNRSSIQTKESIAAKKPEARNMSSLNLGGKHNIVEVESKSLIQKAQELFSIKNVISAAESKPLPPTKKQSSSPISSQERGANITLANRAARIN